MTRTRRVRLDFTVVPTAKRFTVRGRHSEWDGTEWHWLDGWHVNTFGTQERAQSEADRMNSRFTIAAIEGEES